LVLDRRGDAFYYGDIMTTKTANRDEILLDLLADQRAAERGLPILFDASDNIIPPRIAYSVLLTDRNSPMEPEPDVLLTPVQRVVASTDTQTLRQIVKALEADILQAAQDTNGKGTEAHRGMLEMLEAAGAELDRRRRMGESGPAGELSAPWVHVERESGPGGEIRLGGGIRVF
jgi:hypothetical protein